MNTHDTTARMTEQRMRRAAASRADDVDTVNLLDLIRATWRRKWVVLAAVLVTAGFVAALVSQVTPRYTAAAKVALEARERRVVTSEEVVSDLDLSTPVIETEMVVMRASVLLGAVVREIGLERLAELDPADRPASWRERAQEAVRAALGRLGLGRPARGDGAAASGEVAAPPSEAGDPHRRIVGAIRRDLTIEQEGKSYVIIARMTAEDPELAALVVNTIAEQYIASQLAERVDVTRRATAWLENRVADLRQQVTAAEEAVETYRFEKLVADGGGEETARQQLAAMSGELALARADLAGAQASYDQIRALREGEGAAAAAEVLGSPLVTTLREERARLLRERSDLLTRYGDSHPLLVRIGAEIARVEQDLAEQIDGIVETLGQEVAVARSRERSIARSILDTEERLSELSRTSIDLRHLEREADALHAVYGNFLSRLKEARAQDALARPEARVIEYAEPPGAPSSPRTKLLVAAGGVAGLGLGLGLVLLLELGATTFVSARQVSRETGLPVMASLPPARRRQSPADAFRALAAAPHSTFGEKVRELRTALMFGAAEPPRSISVTSSLPGEGKTLTALALAHMGALMGQRVVVLECDARNASLSRAFGWKAEPDLAGVLQGKAAHGAAIVSGRELLFDVLPLARPTPEVADLLSPARLRALIDALLRDYDTVVIDAPPVLHTSNARVIARASDAVLYLVKWRATSIAAIRQGLEALGESGIEPDGVVLTHVRGQDAADMRRPRGDAVPRPVRRFT